MSAPEVILRVEPEDVPAKQRRRRNGAYIEAALRNLAARLRAEDPARPRLTLEAMKEAIVRGPDPYRDWRGAYEADIRRGGAGGGRVVRTGPFLSDRTVVPNHQPRPRRAPRKAVA